MAINGVEPNSVEPGGKRTSTGQATSSTRSDPALVAPARPGDGLTAALALQELGYESRDLGGPLQWE